MTPPLEINSGGEFPTLGKHLQATAISRESPRTRKPSFKSSGQERSSYEGECGAAIGEQSDQKATTASEASGSSYYGESFVKCRIGSRLADYRLDFDKVFEQRHVGELSDFILAPIAPVRPTIYETNSFDVAPDLILHPTDWTQRVAIDLGHPKLDYFDPATTRQFDKLLGHALYLGPSVIVISCPESDLAQTTCASITNDRLKNLLLGPLILFRVSMNCGQYDSRPSSWYSSSGKGTNGHSQAGGTNKRGTRQNMPLDSSTPLLSSSSEVEHEISQTHYNCPWRMWNSIRSHLEPVKLIGVCLSIQDDLSCSQAELDRWTGEPVRMIIINVDQFVRSSAKDQRFQLTNKCREFIKKIMLANSLKTSLVVEALANQDLAEHMQYLDNLIKEIQLAHPDPLRSWDDKIQPPLQPLSSNLDSNVYACFEMDMKKYSLYRESMIQALMRLLSIKQPNQKRQTFVLMVLGAGRGPLVDMFIDAVCSINSKHKFKIYALDKNPSSIRSLKYKQKHHWKDNGTDQFETEVVESDMREWNPQLKADIIATELLGSFSDNELSPECIDGLWTISSSKTISIPQEYSSFLAPICSFKLFQEVQKLHRGADTTAFDQIYVSKLSNYYLIDKPQQLFTFEHKDLSIPPDRKCNERFKKLTFRSQTETVCHGFAGYFSAHLFGTTHLSIVEGQSTANMNSWFPAFIPLEKPILLAKNSQLDVLFWRKESSTSVWYEWTIVKPTRSRIHSQSGINTSMSKFIR